MIYIKKFYLILQASRALVCSVHFQGFKNFAAAIQVLHLDVLLFHVAP